MTSSSDGVSQEDVNIVVKAGMPTIQFPGGEIRLRCFMNHEEFPGEQIEDLEVEREMLPEGTVWHVKSPGENQMNVTIEPELVP